MRRALASIGASVVMVATAVLLLADGSGESPERWCQARTVELHVNGTCGPPGDVKVTIGDDCAMKVEGGGAVGLPANGRSEGFGRGDAATVRTQIEGDVFIGGTRVRRVCTGSGFERPSHFSCDGSDGSSCRAYLYSGAVIVVGDACMSLYECPGPKAECLLAAKVGRPYPGGYCSARCDPKNNDNEGRNAACTGFLARCATVEGEGWCVPACTAMEPARCRRFPEYSCFNEGCLPSIWSECNPDMPESCKSDGGAATCVRAGPDPVGRCMQP